MSSSLTSLSPSALERAKVTLSPGPQKKPDRPMPKGKAPAADSPASKPASDRAPSKTEAAALPSVLDDEEEEDRWVRRMLPAWMVSMLTHTVLLLVLALMTLTIPEKKDPKSLTVLPNDVQDFEDEEVLDDIELDPTEEIVEESVAPSEVQDLSQIESTDFAPTGDAPAIDELDASFAGPIVGDLDDWTELGSEFGKDGIGSGKNSLGAEISFLGVKTKGNRVMYIVDNSNSMNKGRFETAVYELNKSIAKLKPNQYFYIIFYSDTAYPLFYPETAKTWVKATPANKTRVQSWLSRVHRCLKTAGREAFQLAFQMKPDIIHLLGDGAFTDNPVPRVLAIKDSPVVMHTMGFNLVRGRDQFEALAKKFKGKFHDIKVPPAMAELSKRMNRPRNNKRNGVWGIKLGDGPKKKKKK